jgi:hypothetical protein
LADRMMAVLHGCSTASAKQRLSKLVNDAQLPADIRIAVAQKAFADRTSGVRRARRPKSEIRTSSAASVPPETLNRAERDTLLSIVSDASAPDKARRQAAVKLATYFLPKRPVNKRWRFTADECGFAINAEIAREYRTIDFELEPLKRHPNRDFPEIAQRSRKLQARIVAIRQRLQCPPPKDDADAIPRRLQCPPPKGYGDREFAEDCIRLVTFARKREAGIALSAEEDAEEAHRMARFDCYGRCPEQTARHYRENLEGVDNRYRKGRSFEDGTAGPSLSRNERNDLRLLRWLYPPAYSKNHLSAEAETPADGERWIGHPFYDEKPSADGNFYPRDSLLRPASADQSELVKYADVPAYCILVPGQLPIFTDAPPIDLLKAPTLTPPSI